MSEEIKSVDMSIIKCVLSVDVDGEKTEWGLNLHKPVDEKTEEKIDDHYIEAISRSLARAMRKKYLKWAFPNG